MSGPNTQYDPVEVAMLSQDAVDQAVAQALAALAAAPDLDAFKQVRLEHAGDASPLALANREIGALAPAARPPARARPPPPGPAGGRAGGGAGPAGGWGGRARHAARSSRLSATRAS